MALPTLAQVSDVQARYTGGTFTEQQATNVAAWLVDASSLVRRQTHQTLSLVQSVDVLNLDTKGMVRLPQRPIVSIDALKVINPDGSRTAVVDPWFDGLDTISPWLGQGVMVNAPVIWYYERTYTVEVTYTHGFDVIPDEIVAVVCQVVLRRLDQPDAAGTQSLTVGSTGQTWAAQASPGSLFLTPQEIDQLAEYTDDLTTIPLR